MVKFGFVRFVDKSYVSRKQIESTCAMAHAQSKSKSRNCPEGRKLNLCVDLTTQLSIQSAKPMTTSKSIRTRNQHILKSNRQCSSELQAL